MFETAALGGGGGWTPFQQQQKNALASLRFLVPGGGGGGLTTLARSLLLPAWNPAEEPVPVELSDGGGGEDLPRSLPESDHVEPAAHRQQVDEAKERPLHVGPAVLAAHAGRLVQQHVILGGGGEGVHKLGAVSSPLLLLLPPAPPILSLPLLISLSLTSLSPRKGRGGRPE
jgi:hypothetical protein